MDLFKAIKGRRSISVMKPEEPKRELIEKILEAGTWAPNHYATEPWKFIVISGEARNRIGNKMAEIVKMQLHESDSEATKKILDKERSKLLRAPVIIAVACEKSINSKVMEIEQIEAVACSVQNMMLAAYALGLGSIWRTGEIVYKQELAEYLDLRDGEKLLGLVYIGYPDHPGKEAIRKDFEKKTTWLTK